jgi:N-acetylglutamate synthase-like GNAT family acetyltransferase
VLQVEIRRALPGEAANLSALALRSKALWGYDAAFMEACRAPLTVDPEAIAKYPFYVLDEGGTITGFYGLSGAPPRGEIEFLVVEPGRVRSGRGQRLARHFLALARSLGFEEMDVSADPLAEDFYVAMGAVRIAEVPSDAIPNRLIPRLRFSLLADRVAAHHLSDLHR